MKLKNAWWRTGEHPRGAIAPKNEIKFQKLIKKTKTVKDVNEIGKESK